MIRQILDGSRVPYPHKIETREDIITMFEYILKYLNNLDTIGLELRYNSTTSTIEVLVNGLWEPLARQSDLGPGITVPLTNFVAHYNNLP